MIRQTKNSAYTPSTVIELAVLLVLGLAIAGYGAWTVTAGFRAATASTVAALDGPAK